MTDAVSLAIDGWGRVFEAKRETIAKDDMAIQLAPSGAFHIFRDGCWIMGDFETPQAAEKAFSVDEFILNDIRAQCEADGRMITVLDL